MNARSPIVQPSAPAGPDGTLLLDRLSDGVVLFEGGALPVYCNPAAQRLLGLARLRHRGDAEAVFGRDLVQWLDQQRRAGSGDAGERPVMAAVAAGPLPLLVQFQPWAGERWALLMRPDPVAAAAPGANAPLSELDQWFSLIPAGLIVTDGTGRVLRSNPALDALVGRVPGDLAQADPGLRALLGWGTDVDPAVRRADAPVERHVMLSTPDGRGRRVVARCQWHEPAPGEWRMLAVVEDRSAEDERDLARLEMGALMDTAGVGVATFEESRGWLKGIEPGPLAPRSAAGLQSITRDMVLPATLAEYERLQVALRKGDRVEVRYAVRHPELGVRWLQTRVEPGRLASRRTTSVVTLDVTDKEYAQQRSDELLRELTTLLDSTSAGIAYLRGSVLLRCNQRFEALLGLAGNGAAGASLDSLFGDGDDTARRVREGLAGLDETGVFETELATARPDRRWMSLSVRRMPGVAGGEPEAVAVLTDISRLKSQQDELQKLLRERELMFNLSEVGIAYIRDGRVERANESLAALIGRPLDDLIGLSSDWLFESTPHAGGIDGSAGYEAVASPLQPGATAEWLLRRPDREPVWVEVSTRAVSPGDARAGVICSFVDVDDRRRAREQLVVQAERTRAILDSVLVGIVTVGDAGIEWMNRSARRMFGGDLEDFIGQPISTVATPEPEHPLRRTDYLHALAEGRAESFECRLTARDGREFWVVGNAVVTGRESTGRQLTFALLDIERRRQAEIHIAQAQASLQRIIETVPLAIGLFDARSLRLVQANLMATSFLGVGSDDAVGMPLAQLFDPEVAADLARDMSTAGASAQGTRRELRRGGRDGDTLWEVRFVPLVAADDVSVGQQVLMVASDVTEERAAERARLDAAMAQRDMLVREVHHRIKNNLQGVAGLMQQIAIRRPEVAPVIAEAIGQVQAIAQVYGLQVGVAGPLRVRSVIEAIAGSVQRMFGRSIVVDLAGGPAHRWALPEAESIPIALTVNELFTNAVKHGKDAVRCTLTFRDDQVVVAIANTGQLPAGFDLAGVPGGVSGLGLVRALLPRRHARLTLVQNGPDVVATIVLVPPGVALLEPL